LIRKMSGMKIQLKDAMETCLIKLEATIKEMPNPPAEYASCEDGYYFRHKPYLPFTHIGTWMISFFMGEGLLAYHITKEEKYLNWVKSYHLAYEKKLSETSMDTMHDLGFLYTLYSTGIYKESGEEFYKKMSVRAADELAKRMDLEYGFIRAWGRVDVREHHSAGLAIIDCMMNLSLLFFAWKETGNPFYRQIAEIHAENTKKYFIREDGSVCHGYQYRAAGGTPKGEVNHCGYQKGSFWARGLTWAMYGFTLAYRYTGKEDYGILAQTLAQRFLEEIKKDGTDLVPPWDFRLGEGKKLRDSSAAAIAVCTFHELAGLTGKTEFWEKGRLILERLMADYRNRDLESSGFLIHSNGKEHCTSFGDYFYMEALLRYLDEFHGYW
jgi:unsaturated chondroitin disaccharide hydrolase